MFRRVNSCEHWSIWLIICFQMALLSSYIKRVFLELQLHWILHLFVCCVSCSGLQLLLLWWFRATVIFLWEISYFIFLYILLYISVDNILLYGPRKRLMGLSQIFIRSSFWVSGINSWRPHRGFQCQGRLCRCQNLCRQNLVFWSSPTWPGWTVLSYRRPFYWQLTTQQGQPVSLRVVNLPTW